MKKRLCYHCGDYQILSDHGRVVEAYTKPVKSVMVPAYVHRIIEGKQKWERVGFLCERCGTFEYGKELFKPNRRAV